MPANTPLTVCNDNTPNRSFLISASFFKVSNFNTDKQCFDVIQGILNPKTENTEQVQKQNHYIFKRTKGQNGNRIH